MSSRGILSVAETYNQQKEYVAQLDEGFGKMLAFMNQGLLNKILFTCIIGIVGSRVNVAWRIRGPEVNLSCSVVAWSFSKSVS